MQFYSKRTVDEQARRLPYELREAYRNSQIDRITIYDGKDELVVTGYAEYSYLDEKSYQTQPVRTQDGSIQEIEEYATFLTPRLTIRYSIMNIEDYRSLMKMLKKRNGFIVKCYDVVEDKIVKNEMYVAPPSMPKIYKQYLMALGIQEHNIELIGTNTFTKTSFKFNEQKFESYFGMTWGELVDKNSENFYVYESNGKNLIGYMTSTEPPDFYAVRDTETYNIVEKEEYIKNNGLYYGASFDD